MMAAALHAYSREGMNCMPALLKGAPLYTFTSTSIAITLLPACDMLLHAWACRHGYAGRH